VTAAVVAARLLGLAIGAAIGAVALVRRDRPMHAVGRTHHAVVRGTPAHPAGVPWLDDPGERAGLVRFSRGVGLPSWAPDVQGLALRLPEDGRHTDVLFSSGGLRGVGRFLLTARRSPLGGPLTTLMPFHGPRGPVVLAAEPLDETDGASRRAAWPTLTGTRWTLLRSGVTGPWEPFAELVVGADAGPALDRATRFDPVGATPPGLPPYRWAAVLRDPAYRLARTLGR
jgi:hypothetical protein